jgi:hypothetical protein
VVEGAEPRPGAVDLVEALRGTVPLSLWAGVLALSGCKSGTLIGQEQSCEVSGGLLAEERAACPGSVDGVRGSPQLVIVDTDGELDGTYRLEATLSVGKRETKAHVTATDGERVGG